MTIEADARLGSAAFTTGTPHRIALSGITASAGDVGKRVSIGGAGSAGATLQGAITNFVNPSTIDIDASVSVSLGDADILLGTDNAPAIQDAIDNEVEVELPAGLIACGALNMTGDSRASVLAGKGVPFSAGTWLLPFCDTGTFIDCGGRRSILLEGVTFGRQENPNRPDVGLLVGGAAAGNVDHLNIVHVGGTGKFRKATLDIHSGLGTVNGCTFWNFEPGGYGWAWDLDNSLGAVSAGGSLSNVYAASPWAVIRSEAHSGHADARAMLLRGADNVVWTACSLSGFAGQAGVVWVQTANGDQPGMRRHTFLAPRFEGEGGAVANIFVAEGSCLNVYFDPACMFGCTGDIVTGSAATSFRANCTGLPRN